MINSARARAVIHGRDYVTPEDLFDLAEDVVLHRIRVSYEASAAGHTGAQVLESILAESRLDADARMRRQVKLSQDPVDARQFEVTVKHLANSLNFGQEESVFHGGGLEYAQSRLYVPGDPVKFIDWKVSARVGQALHQGIPGAEADPALPAARYLGLDVRELAAAEQVRLGGAHRHGHRARGAGEYDARGPARLRRARAARAPHALAQCRAWNGRTSSGITTFSRRPRWRSARAKWRPR